MSSSPRHKMDPWEHTASSLTDSDPDRLINDLRAPASEEEVTHILKADKLPHTYQGLTRKGLEGILKARSVARSGRWGGKADVSHLYNLRKRTTPVIRLAHEPTVPTPNHGSLTFTESADSVSIGCPLRASPPKRYRHPTLHAPQISPYPPSRR